MPAVQDAVHQAFCQIGRSSDQHHPNVIVFDPQAAVIYTLSKGCDLAFYNRSSEPIVADSSFEIFQSVRNSRLELRQETKDAPASLQGNTEPQGEYFTRWRTSTATVLVKVSDNVQQQLVPLLDSLLVL